MISAYRGPDRTPGRVLMATLIASVSHESDEHPLSQARQGVPWELRA